MSYITKKGKAAGQAAQAENNEASKALVSFKSGTTLKVRLATAEDYVEYFAASVFKVINTTPVAPNSLYAKAADILYKEAFALRDAGDEAGYEEIRNKAYQIKPKPRYLFGFINLADGQPIIVDMTKAQASGVIQTIEKYAKKIDKLAFELSKQGSSTSTTVSLSPVIDMDEDLSDVERKNFEAAAGKEIADDIYGSVLVMKSEDEQRADLQAFGFDDSRLGGESKAGDPDEPEADDPTKQF